MSKTYVFIGGLTEEQALEKLKKYYPEYNYECHRHALYNYLDRASVCNDDNGFCHCYEEWYIENGYTRLDKEETMDRYYKFVTSFDWMAKNIEFEGSYFTSHEAIRLPEGRTEFNNSWTILSLKEFSEITEEEYNKAKNPTVTVSLNIDYSAVISKDGIEVGCQNFTHEAIQNLAKELEKFLDKQ